MTESNDLNKIFVSHHKVKNMKVKELVVPIMIASEYIESYVLDRKIQSEIINEMVESIPDWLSLDSSTQYSKIINRLNSETLVYALKKKGMMKNVSQYSVSRDENESFIITGFIYEDKKIQQKIDKFVKDKQKGELND